MAAHYSERFEENGEGWWVPRCKCGWKGGSYPDAEDACDALMDHAYDAGLHDGAHDSHKAAGA